jgi:putative protease
MILPMDKLEEVGKVLHYFGRIGVAIIELKAPLSIGDQILIKGPTSDFEQAIESMQIEHINVSTAKKGDSIGLKVDKLVKPNDIVYKKSL